MAKERKKAASFEDEAEEGEGWLVSYADMMTLIACFFIMMMAFANYDPVGFQEKAKEIAESFKKVDEANSELKMKKLKDNILQTEEIKKMTSITISNSSLTITLNSTLLFPNNEVDISPEMAMQLDSVIDTIKNYNSNFRIFIEGHSDNTPLPVNSPFANQWAVAAARASSVAERFQYFGFASENIRVLSYGDSRPLKENQDANGKPIYENNILNRRVVIRVVEPVDKRPAVKMGLGVYFD